MRRRAIPYFLSLFFFILFCNYLGMLPGMATATGNLAVTGGLALLTLILIIAVGFIKQGPLWIYKGTVPHGVPFVLGLCLLWPIELIGLLIRPFCTDCSSLRKHDRGTRCRSDLPVSYHDVPVISLWGSVLLWESLMIYVLEMLLVAWLQAFIFTVLSAMFIGSSLHAH